MDTVSVAGADLSEPLAEDGPSGPSGPSRPPHRLRRALLRRPSIGGLALGLAWWWLSLLPSMLPRAALMQAVVGAVCAGAGYALGTLLGSIGHRLLDRLGRTPSPALAARAHRVAPIVAGVVVATGAVVWPLTQNAQRDRFGVAHVSIADTATMLGLTLVLLAVLTFVGRLVSHGVKVLDDLVERWMPPWIAHVAVGVVVVVVGVVVSRDLVWHRFIDWADTSFGAADEGTAPGVSQPTSALVSGGPGSAAPWDTLGKEGRSFVAGGVTPAQLADFWGPGAAVKEPIRVYAGIDSAGDLDVRARLVVDELERTGAFDRRVLVVWTVTGTGWVDPDAAAALEYLHAGDTAIAGMQYSFLPSWISFLVDKDKAAEGGRALNEAVFRRWSQLDPAHRPQLVLFGLSLGSFGLEQAEAGPDAAASVANLRARSQGAFLVGPTHDNPIWQQLTAAREPGTPVWQPVYDGGREVQLAISGATVDAAAPQWSTPRVLVMHHPDDPVGAWSWDMLWSVPAWMDEPRGPLLPERAVWIPFVSFVQGVGDLSAGFSTRPGQGHNYAPDYVRGWVALTPPPDWSEEQTTRLEARVLAESDAAGG